MKDAPLSYLSGRSGTIGLLSGVVCNVAQVADDNHIVAVARCDATVTESVAHFAVTATLDDLDGLGSTAECNVKKLLTILQGDGTGFAHEVSGKVFSGKVPLSAVCAERCVRAGESHTIGVFGDSVILFNRGLALVDCENCALNRGVVGVEKFNNLLFCPHLLRH